MHLTSNILRIALFLSLWVSTLAQPSWLPPDILAQLVNNHPANFQKFKAKNNKKYNSPSEELFRSLIYFRNEKLVTANNLKKDKSYKMGLNKFADLTQDEFQVYFANLLIPDEAVRNYVADVKEAKTLDTQDCYEKTDKELQKLQVLEQKIAKGTDDVRKKTSNYYHHNQLLLESFRTQEATFVKSLLNLPPDEYETILRKLDATRPAYEPPNLESSTTQSKIVPFQMKNMPVLSSILTQTNTTSSTLIAQTLSNTTATNLSSFDKDWSEFAGEARYQGKCGACYAFAAVQNLETVLAIYAFGMPIELSVQQVIDCSTGTNLTLGCNGGYLEGPFMYMMGNGIATDFAYPYTSGGTGKTGTCKSTKGYFQITSYESLAFRDCSAVRVALQKKPVSVAIASYRLQFYESGVFTDCNTELDHAVLLVGYHHSKGWKIKNSWGSDWGENGYAWLADGNSCSICDYAMVMTVSMEG